MSSATSQAIHLNFINQSNDTNNSDVVIFQKNEATGFEELAVAWQVIQNCGQGDNHPFQYPMASSTSAGDSDGNFTPQLQANPGDAFQMIRTPSGDQLVAAGSANSATEIELRNDLPQGAISANIYKSKKLLAKKTNIVPGQMATFAFKPVIYIGLVSQMEEGDVMNSAIVSSINTQISLLGIASADIVMTGGGSGENARPFEFSLQNITMA
jgi:hypothetical protein